LLLAAFAVAVLALAPDTGRAAPAKTGQTVAFAGYGLDFWHESEGLPASRVRRIVQTRDGYLWLGTAGGAVRFDGVSFTLFNIQTGSLKDDEVWALRETRDGGLWIGTLGGGATRFSQGTFTTYTKATGLLDDVIRNIDEDTDGSVWFATTSGVNHYAQGAFTAYTTKQGLAGDVVIRIVARTKAGVFVVAGNRLQRLTGDRFVTEDRLARPEEGRISSLTTGRDGSLWIVFEDGLVKQLKDDVVSTYPLAGGLSARGGSLCEDADGNVWLGSLGGLLRLSEGQFRRVLSESENARLGTVLCLCGDEEGNLWLGLEINGLARLRRTQFMTLTAEDGLPNDSTRTVFQDRTGTIWIGTAAGFAGWSGGQVRSYRELDGTPLSTVTSFAEDSDGTLWVGAGGRLFKLRDGKLTRDPAWKGVFDIKAIYCDRLGRMWIGTDGEGLFEYDGDKWTVLRTQDGLASDQIRGVLCDRQGVLWVLTMGNGISRYADGKFTTYTVKDGLSSNRMLTALEDDDGTLWFGTRFGLNRYRDGKFLSYGARDGLFSSFVSGLADDGRGNLWLSCGQGIFRVSKADFAAQAAGRIKTLRSVTYGIADGMNTTAFSAGVQRTAWRTTDGRLLFCSLKGLVVVDPGHLFSNSHMPSVHIESVLVDRRLLPAGSQAVLPAGRGEVEIHYTALSYLAPTKLVFKYRLEGFDSDWVDAGTRRFAHYTNLPPGDYRFRVIACNDSGVWNTEGDSFAFLLKPHFHQTVWFYLLCGLAVLLLFGIIYGVRLKQLKANERTLQRRVAEEVAKVKVLSGLLPICSNCKKVRDDKGYWNQLESYLKKHSDTTITHSFCPDCMRALFPEVAAEVLGTESPAPAPKAQGPGK
jgi:ligand-binding sensor domain-containing protein